MAWAAAFKTTTTKDEREAVETTRSNKDLHSWAVVNNRMAFKTKEALTLLLPVAAVAAGRAKAVAGVETLNLAEVGKETRCW